LQSDNSNIPPQVIIIDDDHLVRNFAVHTIEYGTNRKVTTFDCGFSAWQFIQAEPEQVDIIIADANIPDMDGLELLRQVKSKYPDKKFVITTSSPDNENTAYQLGADAFLLKPYDIDDLFTLIERLFSNADAPTKKNLSPA
jgi:DNA-binding NarL/FixJ family response regulator